MGKNKPNELYITRIYDAPVKLVWDAWTDPKHIAKWLPPTGATMEYIKASIKEGGTSFYCMTVTGGAKMYGKIHYKEITKPNRIVYTQVFCDAQEKISRHPMAPTWPETMLTTVTFAEEGPNQTRVTVKWEVYGDSTNIERETFHQAKAGMTQGWTGSFDKFEDYLKMPH